MIECAHPTRTNEPQREKRALGPLRDVLWGLTRAADVLQVVFDPRESDIKAKAFLNAIAPANDLGRARTA
jgi:hypothetical protein